MARTTTRTVSNVKPVLRFTAWSLSRFGDYDKCPAFAKFKHLEKRKEPDSPAMARGTEVHKQAERAVNSSKAAIPPALKLFAKEFKAARKHKPFTEQQWAFNAQWQETDWFGANAWVRVIVDLGWHQVRENLLNIVDHKTGKMREEHRDNMSLYAIGGFIKFPRVERVKASFWYLDHGKAVDIEYDRDELAGMQRDWERAVRPMLTDTQFKPTPGAYCRWCPFSKAKGGPCAF